MDHAAVRGIATQKTNLYSMGVLLVLACIVASYVGWSFKAILPQELATKQSKSQRIEDLLDSLDEEDGLSDVPTGGNTPYLDTTSFLSKPAVAFIEDRRKEYEDYSNGSRPSHFWMRGVGHLYEVRNMLIALESVNLDKVNGGTVSESSGVRFKLVNVHPQASGDDCEKLAVWVRAAGPEVVAGIAKVVPRVGNQGCHWEFNADVRVPGSYHIDAKVLLYDLPGGDVGPATVCKTTEKPTFEMIETAFDQYDVHADFQAFKVYEPTKACCEFCTRMQPYCKKWMTPPYRMTKPNRIINGCVLFLDKETPTNRRPVSKLLKDTSVRNNTAMLREHVAYMEKMHPDPPFLLGEPYQLERLSAARTNSKGLYGSWFLGCGWSQWFTLDFPCMNGDLDDKVFMVNDTFEIYGSGVSVNPPPPLPLCQQQHEKLADVSIGRWVKEAKEKYNCTEDLKFHPDFRKFDIAEYIGDKPHCWHRDDLSRIGLRCIEMNCRLIDKSRLYTTSILRTEGEWFGTWHDRRCDLLEYTDEKLQQCITERKITDVSVTGRSLAEFFNEYVKLRLSSIKLFNDKVDPEAVDVEVTSMGLIHFSTHTETDKLDAAIKNLRPSTAKNLRFWIPINFISSEREQWGTFERANYMNQMLEPIFAALNYTSLTGWAMSIPLSYDTAGQMDGMHLVGPTLKMMVTKFFHHLCKDVVGEEQGVSRV